MIGIWAALQQLPQLFNLQQPSDVSLDNLPPVPTEPRDMKCPHEIEPYITTDFLKLWVDKLWDQAEANIPVSGHPSRVLGSPGHKATLDLLKFACGKHENFWNVEYQPFFATTYELKSHDLYANDKHLDSKPLRLSPSGDVTGEVVFADGFGCVPTDFVDVKDKIVIIQRGQCVFGDKSELAGLSGANAVLIFDPNSDDDSGSGSGSDILSGDLGTPLDHQVPTLAISADVAKQLTTGEKVRVVVDSEIKNVATENIILESKMGDHDNVVFVGAHSDSVGDGPGMNDNGSGLIAMLAIVHHLSNFKLKNAVRVAWWSAEEEGLLGSLHYTENLTKREAAKIRMFLDIDMIASPNFANEIYDSDDSENPEGSSMIRDTFIDWYEENGLNYTLQPFDGRSDYVGFINIGIPAGGFDSGAEKIKSHKDKELFGGTEGIAYDPCYHESCDDRSNLNYDAFLNNAKMIAYTVAKYSQSLTGFPKRDLSYYEQAEEQKPRLNNGFVKI